MPFRLRTIQTTTTVLSLAFGYRIKGQKTAPVVVGGCVCAHCGGR